jgi:hypothetical protein
MAKSQRPVVMDKLSSSDISWIFAIKVFKPHAHTHHVVIIVIIAIIAT